MIREPIIFVLDLNNTVFIIESKNKDIIFSSDITFADIQHVYINGKKIKVRDNLEAYTLIIYNILKGKKVEFFAVHRDYTVYGSISRVIMSDSLAERIKQIGDIKRLEDFLLNIVPKFSFKLE